MPSADNPGKGSRRRLAAVPDRELEERWRRAFGGTTDALEILRREHGPEVEAMVEAELKKLRSEA